MARLCLPFVFQMLVEGPRDDLIAPLLIELCALVLLTSLIGLLVSELVVALEPLGRDLAGVSSCAYGTSWFGPMPAIAEAAFGSPVFDVREGAAERVAGFPELELAHAWRVYEYSATRQHDELPGRRRVTTAAVRDAHVARRHQLVAKELVHDAGLADT